MLHISNSVSINENEITFEAIRAQGAGGQKVNKTSVAVHLRFNITASSLPEFYKERLLTLKDKRITKDGIIVIKSQQHRSQEQNRSEALERLAILIKSVNTSKKKRLPTKPTKGSVNRRLQSKKKHANNKRLRAKINIELS